MTLLRGKELVITHAYSEYYIANEGGKHMWVDEMLEDVEEENKEEVKFEAGKWYKYSAEHLYSKVYSKYSGKQDVSGRFYYDEIIREDSGYEKYHDWSSLVCKPILLTDLSEIQQYLPENHPDKIKKKTKKVEDLRYPDAVHCVSKEEHYKVKQFANIGDYNGNCYYLLDAKSWRKEPWTGMCASNLESRTTYTNYEFSDIIFPEGKVEAKHMLSKEELLAEAKRRYPIGTRFCNSNMIKGCKLIVTVTGHKYYSNTNYTNDLLIDSSACNSSDKYSSYTIYLNGEWAEIISEPAAEKEVERLSFYVKYNTSFTEDLYNKLVDWCVKNNAFKTRGWNDSYEGLIENGFFIYDSAGFHGTGLFGYGVDNNRQGCMNEYSIKQVKELIGYEEVLGHTNSAQWKMPRYLAVVDSYEDNAASMGGGRCDYTKGCLEQIFKHPLSPVHLYEQNHDSDEIYVPIIKTEVKQIKL